MLLADMGADVLRVDRPVAPGDLGPKIGGKHKNLTGRGRRSVTLDLKNSESADAALELMSKADVVIEGFRPGTMERLGIGPDAALARNPKLVYGRMTGWGQTGPLAQRAGHDLNYIALSGVLSGIGRAGEAPVPPLNLVGDYGGGGMLLALGVVAALFNVQRGGAGQVVDAAMIEGAAQLGTIFWGVGQLARDAREQSARWRHAVVRQLSHARRALHVRRGGGGALLRGIAAEARTRRRKFARAARSRRMAGAEGAVRGGVCRTHAR
jgi:alpha-methylacyl-CoA racemase